MLLNMVFSGVGGFGLDGVAVLGRGAMVSAVAGGGTGWGAVDGAVTAAADKGGGVVCPVFSFCSAGVD